MSERTGRCLCGAVTFKLSGEPIATRICWCRTCQHISANGTVNVLVPAQALSFAGTLAAYTSKADSGNDITREFCPSCGTHLFAHSPARPQFRVVRVGNFDDPSSLVPGMNIWTASAPGWACIDPALEQAERQPPFPKPAAIAGQA